MPAVWFLYGAAVVSYALNRLLSTSAGDQTNALVAFAIVGLSLMVVQSFATIDSDDDDHVPGWLMRLVFVVALIALVVIGAAHLWGGGMQALFPVLLGTASSFAVGALLGFIFGVPRAVVSRTTTPDDDRDRSYTPNTNLERVSEWLTGIIVGLTLVNFDKLRDAFEHVVGMFAAALDSHGLFVPSALLVFFASAGFLLSYLWTRLRLLQDLTRADDTARREPEFLEGLVNAYCYTDPPKGFLRAIKCAKEYRRRFRYANPRVLLHLACAYGQQHYYLTSGDTAARRREIGMGSDETAKLALEAVKDCVDADGTYKKNLRALWDPNDPGRGTTDDDLESLLTDRGFQKYFGPPIKKAAKSPTTPLA